MTPEAKAARHLFLLRTLLIVSSAFWAFSPAFHGDWLMDDHFYLPQNALLHDPHRLWKIWFAPGSLIEYYPIEATLQATQWHFWQLNTLGYHLTNVVLHIAGALLVWRLLAKFDLRYAWLGGLLFAVHPVVVESVAWISEFKNVLSLPPFLLAMCSWIDFENRGRSRDYLLALVLFFIAMLCKISMAAFPVVILLYAWWKRGRISWSDLKRAAPFFLVSLVLGLTSIEAGRRFFHDHLQTQVDPNIGGSAMHIALAGQSLFYYLSECVWPFNLVPLSPYQWPVHPESPLSYTPWIVLAAALLFFWSRRATWGRHALLGFGFFLLTLLPFLGLNSVSYMSYTWVNDHFLYLPMIGLIGLAVAALANLESQFSVRTRPVLVGLIAIAFAALALESECLAGAFADAEAPWTYILARNPDSWLAHNNLGLVYMEKADQEKDPDRQREEFEKAIPQFQQALTLNPHSLDAGTNLGFAYELTLQPRDALAQYEATLRINPNYGITLFHMGHVLETMGRIPEAISYYQQALRVNPRDDGSREALTRLQNGNKGAE